MTYDCAVKVNGKWYGAGDEVEPTLPASVTAKEKEQVKTVAPDKEVKQEVKKPATTKKSSNKKDSKK